MAFPPHMGGFNAARFPTVNQNWAGFQGNVPQFIPTMNVRQQFRPVFPPPPHVQMMSPGMVRAIDYRCDNRRFWLSAHSCQAPTQTSQNLELEQQIRILRAD